MADPENFGGGGFEAQNLKNSDVFTKTESDFSAEIGNSNVGGDASRNGAELFEIEADFSAKIVTFRLVGGMHPPIPPLNPPLLSSSREQGIFEDLQASRPRTSKCVLGDILENKDSLEDSTSANSIRNWCSPAITTFH